ncbi:MAG: thioesterase family protein [Lysobacterales bacterium]
MDNRFSIHIPPGWDVAGNTNGGYLMMEAARIMCALAERQKAVSVTGHYLRPVGHGPCELRCQVLKQGRRLTTVRADVYFQQKMALTVLGAFADNIEPDEAARIFTQGPPTLPPPPNCVVAWHPPTCASLYERITILADPAVPSMLTGQKAGKGTLEAWIGPPQGKDQASTFELMLLVDVFQPAAFDLGLPINWTPTIELTVHIRGAPAPGWLRARVATEFVSGGLLDESVVLWDSEDQLVAHSRQISVEPRKP